jgi:uncharacterized protein YyaL (SSP411 family)
VRNLMGMLLLMTALASTVNAAEIATGKAKPNDLYNNASPYLALHGRDPVRWHEWNAKTMALAKAQNKLLFVSSGYFSCRWCHVMQHESYQNKKIAALLNKYFIAVKVDRELSPALDARLIDFVERTQGTAGWPLNVFVTPEGYPLIGMTYLPPEKFESVLNQLQQQWQQKRKDLQTLAKSASTELNAAVVTQSSNLPAGIAAQIEKKFVNAASAYEDDLQGGFGQQNKFPSVPQLQALLTIYEQQPDAQIKRFLTLTLDHMATLGLRDQLSGGFFRYSVDPGWHVPHFEKMLYDNALLAKFYLEAGRVFANPDYTQVGRDTLDFVLRELKTDTGAYAASLSALDGQGVEGGYYLWESKQVQALLDKQEWEVARRLWDLDGPPDLEQSHHLRQVMTEQTLAKELNLDLATVNKLITSARDKLIAARLQRQLPKDNKKLAAWNALLLSALVEAVHSTNQPQYRQAAQALHDYLFRELWNGHSLARAKDSKGALTDGTLEDYAYVIAGVYDWWRLSKDPQDQAWLQQLINAAWQNFYGQQGWQLAQNMLLRYGEGSTLVSDGVLPSAASVLIIYTYRFALDAHDSNLEQQALRAMNVGLDELEKEPFWYATQVTALMLAQTKK